MHGKYLFTQTYNCIPSIIKNIFALIKNSFFIIFKGKTSMSHLSEEVPVHQKKKDWNYNYFFFGAISVNAPGA